MLFEGMGVKEYKGTEESWQLCSQMGMVHMSADGGVGNWGSLRAPLNLGVIDQWASPMLACSVILRVSYNTACNDVITVGDKHWKLSLVLVTWVMF